MNTVHRMPHHVGSEKIEQPPTIWNMSLLGEKVEGQGKFRPKPFGFSVQKLEEPAPRLHN